MQMMVPGLIIVLLFLVVFQHFDPPKPRMTKEAREQNNLMWDAQVKNSTILFMHVKKSHRYSTDLRIRKG